MIESATQKHEADAEGECSTASTEAWEKAKRALQALKTSAADENACSCDIPLPSKPNSTNSYQASWFGVPVAPGMPYPPPPMWNPQMPPFAPYSPYPQYGGVGLPGTPPMPTKRFGFNSRPSRPLSHVSPPGIVYPTKVSTPQSSVMGNDESLQGPPTIPRHPSLSGDKKPKGSFSAADWPPGLAGYIDRAYQMCRPNTNEKDLVEAKLKVKLTPLFETGAVHSITWDTEKLPLEPGFNINPPGAAGLSPGQSATGPRFQMRLTGPGGAFRGRGAGGLGNRGGGGRNVLAAAQKSFRQRRSPSRGRESVTESPQKKSKRQGYDKRRGGSRSPAEPGEESLSKKSEHRFVKNRWSPSHSQSSRSSSSSRSKDADNDDTSTSKNGSTDFHHRNNKDFIPLSKTARKKLNKRLKMEQEKQRKAETAKGGKKRPSAALRFQSVYNDTAEEQARLRQRAQRFAKTAIKPVVAACRLDRSMDMFNDEDDFEVCKDASLDYSELKIVGTCADIEKSFFRLTTHPDPSQIRPETVLKKSLELVKQKWKENRDYRYACDQLKAIRQDLTIQGIRNEFAVKTYETHARIALEKGDIQEFNQCQAQLKSLYQEVPGCKHEYEFTAYRLLYYIYMENTIDITTTMAYLSSEAKSDICIQYVLKLRSAWTMNNYHRFFSLYKTAPLMSAYLVGVFANRQRKAALRAVLKTYKPTVPVEFVSSELGFESISDCLEFLMPIVGPNLIEDNAKIDCRIAVDTSLLH